jgi:glycosyltransferase involved in cell wall biosynthesis
VTPRRVVLAANSLWNIMNFRAGLIRALGEAGYDPVVVAPADDSLADRMAELGGRHVAVAVDRSGLNPVADLRLIAEYRRVLAEIRPAALLGFTIKPNIYGCLAARSLRIPAIANISGLGTVFIRRGPLLALVTVLYRFALARAAVVFFQNVDDRALFLERRIVRGDQARLLPGSGIDLERYAREPLPPGPVTFLLIARLLGDKGVREYVAAAEMLHGELPDARFQLLGPIDADNRTAISRSELDRWVESGTIDYLGETDDVRPFIARAGVVVLPSYREGMPRSLLEAAAMGRPLIAADVPGCRGIVEDGANGFLCAAKDPESLADAMRRMARLTGEQRQAMGNAARKRVESEFSEAVVIRAYLDALGKLSAAES